MNSKRKSQVLLPCLRFSPPRPKRSCVCLGKTRFDFERLPLDLRNLVFYWKRKSHFLDRCQRLQGCLRFPQLRCIRILRLGEPPITDLTYSLLLRTGHERRALHIWKHWFIGGQSLPRSVLTASFPQETLVLRGECARTLLSFWKFTYSYDVLAFSAFGTHRMTGDAQDIGLASGLSDSEWDDSEDEDESEDDELDVVLTEELGTSGWHPSGRRMW